MMRVTWQTYGRKEIEKETMRYWFDKLIAYDFEVVTIAFDNWIKNQRELPTVKDITDLCKPKVTIHARLPSPLAKESNKQHMEELKEAVKKMSNPRADKYTAWIFRILDNPKNYPDTSFKYATQAKAKLGI